MNKANLAAGTFLVAGVLGLGAATTYAALEDPVPASSQDEPGEDRGLHLGKDHEREGKGEGKDNGLHLGRDGAPGQTGEAPGLADKGEKSKKPDKPGKGPKAR